MSFPAGQLSQELARAKRSGRLAPFWLATGSEPLLMIESGDVLRACAREMGYADRQVLEMSANSDWSQLLDSAASIGMFEDLKFLEVRIPTGKPGVRGAKALAEYVEQPIEGVVTLFTMPRPDWQGVKASWWQALSKASTVIDCDAIERRDLPGWLSARMAANKQSADEEALETFADLVEGNLLAAKQEVAKLSLLYPEGKLTRSQIESSVGNCSRYTTEALVESILTGQPERAARIVDGLEAQGEVFPILMMVLTTQLRNLVKLRTAQEQGQSFVKGVFATPALKAAARRLTLKKLANALSVCADIDRITKGLEVENRDSDPWIELKSVCLFLAR
ncbi:DNA polymerase III subunit delta [Sutterella sp.]|uniref:DNA polymerase III subunit delta n=1 Tax=Sutterella sp. TaxID=1981025 RepID=UPI0026DF6A8E|nr:DNA polymerase III subunit delta [Sutterella sp.]MDO5531724.1 DNA polymerase III subunit delta [Sutterella sp.]